MKELIEIVFVAFVLLVFALSALETQHFDEETIIKPSTTKEVVPEHSFRMGPVLLKFDKEMDN